MTCTLNAWQSYLHYRFAILENANKKVVLLVCDYALLSEPLNKRRNQQATAFDTLQLKTLDGRFPFIGSNWIWDFLCFMFFFSSIYSCWHSHRCTIATVQTDLISLEWKKGFVVCHFVVRDMLLPYHRLHIHLKVNHFKCFNDFPEKIEKGTEILATFQWRCFGFLYTLSRYFLRLRMPSFWLSECSCQFIFFTMLNFTYTQTKGTLYRSQWAHSFVLYFLLL